MTIKTIVYNNIFQDHFKLPLTETLSKTIQTSWFWAPNLNKIEEKALKQLKRDKNKTILGADKAMAKVVMVKMEYISKSQNPFKHNSTYRPLSVDLTNKLKKTY